MLITATIIIYTRSQTLFGNANVQEALLRRVSIETEFQAQVRSQSGDWERALKKIPNGVYPN